MDSQMIDVTSHSEASPEYWNCDEWSLSEEEDGLLQDGLCASPKSPWNIIWHVQHEAGKGNAVAERLVSRLRGGDLDGLREQWAASDPSRIVADVPVEEPALDRTKKKSITITGGIDREIVLNEKAARVRDERRAAIAATLLIVGSGSFILWQQKDQDTPDRFLSDRKIRKEEDMTIEEKKCLNEISELNLELTYRGPSDALCKKVGPVLQTFFALPEEIQGHHLHTFSSPISSLLTMYRRGGHDLRVLKDTENAVQEIEETIAHISPLESTEIAAEYSHSNSSAAEVQHACNMLEIALMAYKESMHDFPDAVDRQTEIIERSLADARIMLTQAKRREGGTQVSLLD